MTSVAVLERGNVPKRAYITTAAYATDIYTYTTSYDAPTYKWSGTLTSFSTGSVNMGAYNVAGVVLRETGKKLYPGGANPDVNTYMVGVYHPEFGPGFIDPNSPKFAVYNSDKPNYIADGVDPAVGGLFDQGQPVYTRGTITTTGGNIVATSTANGTGSVLLGSGASTTGFNNVVAIGAAATADTSIVSLGPIRSQTVTTLTDSGSSSTTIFINPTDSQNFILTIGNDNNGNRPIDITPALTNIPDGTMIYIVIIGGGTANTPGHGFDFGGRFRTLNAGAYTNIGTGIYGFTFVCMTNVMYQVGGSTSAISQ